MRHQKCPKCNGGNPECALCEGTKKVPKGGQVCPGCAGNGTYNFDKTCAVCKGEGLVWRT